MAKYIVEGPTPLKGQIKVSGSKNSSLKLIAACILSDKPCTISDIPEISDTKKMLEIIKNLGGKVEIRGKNTTIDCSAINSFSPKDSLVNSMRASVVVIGPLLARFKKVEISHPGGCLIGSRPIDTHIKAFKEMGVKVTEKNNHFVFESKQIKGSKVILSEMSVTATENVMLLATLAEGETEIRVAAAEPEIEDLACFLNKMGAKIQGAGTHNIKIKGVKKLNGAIHTVMPDHIEAGTLAVAAAASKGNLKITNIVPQHLDIILNKFKEINVNFVLGHNFLTIKPSQKLKNVYIDTRPYPGFSTDLQAPIAVLLTQAQGNSRIFETLFENRFNYANELAKMGAKIASPDIHTLTIKGPTKLHATNITCSDLRAGATMVIAAMIAYGKTTIDNVELIDRGYEKFEERLNSIGAKIQRIK
ncbi:MAG: UDP-N-acetylglucosamine 1-carboxyvinyltransferase [Candidatus Berkelbacteria bacterium]|nr:UDP-N-acetylglucosamine 1-carboxyvinyltransferase [Candidatus Berkelbacteria bacterium]